MTHPLPQSESLWHKCKAPFLPRRTVDGDWTTAVGQTWRRQVDGKWQYKQDAQSIEDWAGGVF